MIEHITNQSLTFKDFIKVTNLEERKRKIEEYFNTSFSVSCQLKQNNQTIMSCDQYFLNIMSITNGIIGISIS